MKIIFLFFIFTIMILPSYGQNNDTSITEQDLRELKQELTKEMDNLKDSVKIDISLINEKQESMITDINQTLLNMNSKLDTLQGQQSDTSMSVWASSTFSTMITIALSLAAIITGISLSFTPIEKHQRKKSLSWIGAGFLIGALTVLLLQHIQNL